MNSCKKVLLLVLLATLALAQTNFNNSCQSDSMLPLLATGVINLNPMDTYNAGSNKDFYRDLSSAQFQTTDVLGYGFALSGFQANCAQSYYTLIIDKVQFENQNTRMRIVVNFLNPSSIGTSTNVTRWNLVTFTYIVVSRNFGGSSTTIWATTAETAVTNDIVHKSIDSIASAYQQAAAPTGDCVVYKDPNFVFDAACAAGTAWDGTTTGGGKMIVHAYIMGFQWNTAKSTTQHLGGYGFLFNPAAFDSTAAEAYTTGAGLTADPGADVTGPNIVYQTATPAGPVVYVGNQNGALQYIKLAFVYSVMDSAYKPTQSPTTHYPTVYHEDLVNQKSSALSYSSSYVFTKVSKFNVAVPITQGDTTKTTDYNQHYMTLPDARYAIYGLTGFSFPKNKNSLCSSTIWVNSTLDNINTYTISTPNPNPTDFWFSADIFVKNIFEICTPSDGTSPFSFLTNIGKKSYFTVPTQSIQQFILEWPINTLTTASIATTNTDAPNAPGGAVTATKWPGSDFAGVSIESVPDPATAG